MAKPRTFFVCQACGHQEPKWMGRCSGCGTWNTLVEEAPMQIGAGVEIAKASGKVQKLSEVAQESASRVTTGSSEFDRVLGGGLVSGSLVLVGGDPGIGKSTLLLQTLGYLGKTGQSALYMTAEESGQQVKGRAERLDVSPDVIHLLADTRLEALRSAVEEVRPSVLVVDSIQTVGSESITSAIGSVSQIRTVTQGLMRFAKDQGITTFVVGHVTKEGTIAGPKVMEHMVDTVLYFEGERNGSYRILRAHKNRFGSAHEIGVFEMSSTGLNPVDNPSAFFLSERSQGEGTAVVTSLQGTRPLLLEVQALTTDSPYGTPRRTTVGIDQQRVAMLCAVMERHLDYSMVGQDVYVNIAGGVRVSEPAVDLGVLVAMASTLRKQPVPTDTVFVGEVGLSGEVRAVSQQEARINEAASLGFKQCVVPEQDAAKSDGRLRIVPARTVRDALDILENPR